MKSGQINRFTSGKPGMPSAGFACRSNSAGGRGLQDRAPASGHVNGAKKTGDQCKAERIAIVVPRISADLAPLKTLLPVPPFPADLLSGAIFRHDRLLLCVRPWWGDFRLISCRLLAHFGDPMPKRTLERELSPDSPRICRSNAIWSVCGLRLSRRQQRCGRRPWPCRAYLRTEAPCHR